MDVIEALAPSGTEGDRAHYGLIIDSRDRGARSPIQEAWARDHRFKRPELAITDSRDLGLPDAPRIAQPDGVLAKDSPEPHGKGSRSRAVARLVARHRMFFPSR